MCGIAGYWERGRLAYEGGEVLRAMAFALRHRGPDDQGTWQDDGPGIGLAHRRLSILDLSPEGHQPMVSRSERFVLVFNGEIYNFGSLRQECAASGSFRGGSDTEVMLAAFDRWGVEGATRRFEGMFAFAVWDREREELHLVRDRMGEKPLYFGWAGTALLFASELKALRRHPSWSGEIDRGALTLYMRYGYVPTPWCIHQGISKLAPGRIATFRRPEPGARPHLRAYWSVRDVLEEAPAVNPTTSADDESALADLEHLLREVVEQEMVADVPLGAFLSGGIDSSLVVALMQRSSDRPVRTFTIGFDEDAFDEADHARAVARHLGTDHTELYVSPARARTVIPRLPDLYDEPFADPTEIPNFLVSELAAAHVTVSLSGDGGDELFGGYDTYRTAPEMWTRASRLPLPVRRSVAALVRAVPEERWNRGIARAAVRQIAPDLSGDRLHALASFLAAPDRVSLYRSLVSHWHDPARLVLGGREPDANEASPSVDRNGVSFEELLMHLDLGAYLPDDILVKVDRASMGVSLESRAPFLHHRVVEFALGLPLELKIRDGVGKWLLRRLLYRYVPRELVDRPKKGFAVPVREWLRGPLRSWADELLSPERLRLEGFLDAAAVQRRWHEHLEGVDRWTASLWTVLMFEEWLEAGTEGRALAAASGAGSRTPAAVREG